MRRDKATTAVIVLTGLFMAGFIVQLFLASLGMMGAESYDAHEGFGYTVMHALSLLVFIAMVAGPNRKRDWPWGLGFFVYVTFLIFIASTRPDAPWVAAFHPLLAFGSAGFAAYLHRRARATGTPAETAAAPA